MSQHTCTHTLTSTATLHFLWASTLCSTDPPDISLPRPSAPHSSTSLPHPTRNASSAQKGPARPVIGQCPWYQELTRRRRKGRKQGRGVLWGVGGTTFISVPRTGSQLTMDTAGYSQWGGGLDEAPRGMSQQWNCLTGPLGSL